MVRRIGARATLVAVLAACAGVGVVAQDWSLTASILGYPHWECLLFGSAGAEFGAQLQAASGLISKYPHWESMQSVASALADAFIGALSAASR
ncbi:hypothetical protein GCM10022251_42680 [Phytohabitans flavus]|uniref:Uncharacterized protein n=1 Tax=Phytohabitans flavus TaxID=1076124 RepID=A0A6F8XYU6_9ACTN|nr:hypothetical protein [Phytohabitans flavus]BCB79024.1 hypothetical protein Pflav_054340 [Phytohabitans flavus]